jgi:hypothetical protein
VKQCGTIEKNETKENVNEDATVLPIDFSSFNYLGFCVSLEGTGIYSESTHLWKKHPRTHVPFAHLTGRPMIIKQPLSSSVM